MSLLQNAENMLSVLAAQDGIYWPLRTVAAVSGVHVLFQL